MAVGKKSISADENTIAEAFRNYPTYGSWKKIGFGPRFGSLIHLASIRSRQNQGVGDFADLKLFKELSAKMGSSIIQLLPLNDMGRSKVPYSSISAFALDPIYISLESIQEMKENRSDEVNLYLKENWHIVEEQKNSKYTDFDKLRAFKFGLLYRLFWDFLNRNWHSNTPRWRQFQSFIQNNAYWLEDYAIFRSLKNTFNWSSWKDWPAEYRDRNMKALDRFRDENRDELLYVKFIQWVAYEQLVQAHNECFAEGILLKGDIPLQVDFDSADVWAHRDYFNLDVCAGAPPDQYSQMGQNWGSPTYNWDNLCRDNYVFWRKRLEYSSHFYDIFRIDHIVGIFRIWTIPITPEFARGVPSGWNGYYQPEDPGEGHRKPVWENHGKSILKMMIESCEMLPIGEDLGTIPAVCRTVMKEMGIPGYKVLIWERDWPRKDSPFFEPSEYDYISMATSTTHDFWSLPGYWQHRDKDPGLEKEQSKAIKDLWRFIMGKKEFQNDYTPEFHREMLKRLFESNSIFLILPFGDIWGKIPGIYGEDYDYDRINDPGNPHREANWAVKIPINIEAYTTNPKIKPTLEEVRKLAESTGRFAE